MALWIRKGKGHLLPLAQSLGADVGFTAAPAKLTVHTNVFQSFVPFLAKQSISSCLTNVTRTATARRAGEQPFYFLLLCF